MISLLWVFFSTPCMRLSSTTYVPYTQFMFMERQTLLYSLSDKFCDKISKYATANLFHIFSNSPVQSPSKRRCYFMCCSAEGNYIRWSVSQEVNFQRWMVAKPVHTVIPRTTRGVMGSEHCVLDKATLWEK